MPRDVTPLTDNDPIWYASYGSNCLAARFIVYLTGGRAPGAARDERGARDRTEPAASAAHWFSTPSRFVGDSAKWGGGGVAFLDHNGNGSTPGRRYLITKGQFDDVAAQESRRPTTSLPIHELPIGTVHPIGSGFYDGLLRLPAVDGVPVVTFTSPHAEITLPPNPPSAAYLGAIIRGLAEVHPLAIEDLAGAVFDSPGISLGWMVEEIAALV